MMTPKDWLKDDEPTSTASRGSPLSGSVASMARAADGAVLAAQHATAAIQRRSPLEKGRPRGERTELSSIRPQPPGSLDRVSSFPRRRERDPGRHGRSEDSDASPIS